MVGGQNGHMAMADVHGNDTDYIEDDDAYYNLVSKNSVTMVKTDHLWSHVQQLKLGGTFQEQYDVRSWRHFNDQLIKEFWIHTLGNSACP